MVLRTRLLQLHWRNMAVGKLNEPFAAKTGAVQLELPGAGLPPTERFIARIGFALVRRISSRDRLTRLFAHELELILELVGNCDPIAGSQPVLIDRIRGIEDSSRNWSVYMTLDHLRIVNEAIAAAIESLGRGIVPEGHVSIADVKPAAKRDASAIEAFEQACALYLSTIDNVANLKTAAKYPHPWFGPLNGSGWHALAAMHMRIHRQQIERIIDGLN